MNSILSLSLDQLQARFEEWGQAPWRAAQLLDWIYQKHVKSFSECTNLSKSLREQLLQEYSFYTAPLVTLSGREGETRKFLWKLEDGNFVESVLIGDGPEQEDQADVRKTLCLSTQVGCAYGCKFCASGRSGFVRDLTSSEIVEQLLGVERWNPKPEERLVSNIVVMGMGEPLSNYENLLAALSILNAPWGCNIGSRKITISTSGLVPEILRLAEEPQQYRLAISLHAATDEVRRQIMPVSRKYPMEALLAACEKYQKAKGRMISFEYILINELNDSVDQCQGLAAIARKFHAHVNLIPFNKVEGCSFRRPPQDVIQGFYQELERLGVSVTLRQEKGSDINAACGQLRLRQKEGK